MSTSVPETLLERLQSLARAAANEIDRSVYLAQWAGAMARLGHIARARKEISELRAVNSGYSPQLTAWILIAEGLADHYESLSVHALDKFKRAHGLARSFQDSEIGSLASAWMSAGEYLVGDYSNATKHAVEAIQSAPPTGTLALSRAHLVLGNIFYVTGEYVAAGPQYGKARRFAIEAHDISMQSAVLYNVAAFHIARISLEDALGRTPTDEIGIAELELNSVDNLDTGLGIDSLRAMIPVLRAQLELVKGNWANANEHYSNAIPEAATYGQLRWESRFLAEQAHCQAMLGMRESAESLASNAIHQLSARVDLDDLAACHARLGLCFGSLGEHAASEEHRVLGKQYAAMWTSRQQAQREQTAPLIQAVK